MNNPLTIEQFGEALLKTGDLDPVYTAINAAKPDLTYEQLCQLCLSYWCFYHLGVAAYMAEERTAKGFWAAMTRAAENATPSPAGGRWPRGAERRHFRGVFATKAVGSLAARYKTATAAVSAMLHPVDSSARPTFGGVSARVQEHVGFGPWIAFKIADMAERVLGAPVDFSNCELGIYKDPRQGAALAWYEDALRTPNKVNGTYKTAPWTYPIGDGDFSQTVDRYVKHFRKFKAPPYGDRPVNVQEVETIFCKYKSHRKGHYPVGKDTNEVGHGLAGWGGLAERLNHGLDTTRDKVTAWRKRHDA